MLSSGTLQNYRDPLFLGKAVELAASFKVNVVSKDETEKGLRAILNFGHTVGHAIESYMKYKSISHGEAVAVGMKIVAEISLKMDNLNKDEYNEIVGMIDKYELVRNKFKLKPDHIISHMKYDKKNKDDKIQFVLLKKIYEPVINCQVEDKVLSDIISEYK
jgi:3-dehydroquinate synthase